MKGMKETPRYSRRKVGGVGRARQQMSRWKDDDGAPNAPWRMVCQTCSRQMSWTDLSRRHAGLLLHHLFYQIHTLLFLPHAIFSPSCYTFRASTAHPQPAGPLLVVFPMGLPVNMPVKAHAMAEWTEEYGKHLQHASAQHRNIILPLAAYTSCQQTRYETSNARMALAARISSTPLRTRGIAITLHAGRARAARTRTLR